MGAGPFARHVPGGFHWCVGTWISRSQRLVLHRQRGPRPGLASFPDVAYGLIFFRLLVWSLIPVGPIFVAPSANPYPNPAYEGSIGNGGTGRRCQGLA